MNTTQLAAEAAAQIQPQCSSRCDSLETKTRIIQTAIEKAVGSEMTLVDIDSQSWGGIKLEWRPNEHRLYAYSDTGDFLFSGSPAYLIWKCIRQSNAAHASEPSEITNEIGILREVLKALIVWIAQSSVGVISQMDAKQLIDKLEANRI